jgi:hypothetical protein
MIYMSDSRTKKARSSYGTKSYTGVITKTALKNHDSPEVFNNNNSNNNKKTESKGKSLIQISFF